MTEIQLTLLTARNNNRIKLKSLKQKIMRKLEKSELKNIRAEIRWTNNGFRNVNTSTKDGFISKLWSDCINLHKKFGVSQ
jgi:hypothetical protein